MSIYRLGALIAFTAAVAACDRLFGKKERKPDMEPADCKDRWCKISKGPFEGKKIEFKQTPVTNAEWGTVARGLGQDRFVLLHHDSETGETRIEKQGKTAEELLPEELRSDASGVQFDQGEVVVLGSLVLLKMVDNPSAQYNQGERVYSGADWPAVGVTYFHAVTWALLKSQQEGGRYKYDLPTDKEHEYVASNAGKCDFGTEACTSLYASDGRKLAHIGEWQDGQGRITVSVNDPKYDQRLPFGVQTTGNVWRWIRFNPKEHWKYGLRGGSWSSVPGYGHAAIRFGGGPVIRYGNVGFSVVRQDFK